MLLTSHILIFSGLVAVLCGEVSAQQSLERRRHMTPSSGSQGDSSGSMTVGGSGPFKFTTSGVSPGPAKNGDPGIVCPVIVQPKEWTVIFDPIPPGCYEEEQSVPIKWRIASKEQAPGGGTSTTPVIYFYLYFNNPDKKVKAGGHDKVAVLTSPAMPLIKIHGKDELVPLCASKGETLIKMPPKGKVPPESLWPINTQPWGISAHTWSTIESGVQDTELSSAPAPSELTASTGYFVAPVGKCKDFGRAH